MNRITRFLFAQFICITIMCILQGCFITYPHDNSEYAGENPELYTVAANSVLGLFKGNTVQTLALETDTQGRVLFACYGESNTYTKQDCGVLGILIMQRVENEQVYWIEDDNVLVREAPLNKTFSKAFVTKYFSEVEMSALKADNHWDEALTGEMVSKNISREFADIFPQEIRESAFLQVSEEYWPAYDKLLTTDASGRAIYCIRGVKKTLYGGNGEKSCFLLMIDSDGEVCAIEEVRDAWNYRDQMREFKQTNGWNT